MPMRPILGVFTIVAACAAAAGAGPQPARPAGWQLPLDADELVNPVRDSAEALAAGKALYAQKCQRCHGVTGEGNGPDADPARREGMDLTDPARARRNPDGVVFHKILSGRGRPDMPAFKDDLTTEQIWAVVAFAQSLRRSAERFQVESAFSRTWD